MKKLILIVMVAILTIGTVHAIEAFKPVPRWKIENPCFDNTDKWYAR